MIISPVMKFIVDKESGYPSPSEKEKLDRAITKFRRILANLTGTFNIAETKFGLADMLVGRNEPGDFAEAMRLYNYILDVAPTSYLRARALVGKAELLIKSEEKATLKEAVALCEKARDILKDDLSDFFTAKAFVVEAELLAKLGMQNHKKAQSLLDKVIKNKHANAYFKARSIVQRVEMPLFNPKFNKVLPLIKLTKEAHKLLVDRPNDYFAIKALLLEAEMLTRKGTKSDLSAAQAICTKVIANKAAERGLAARAKLDLATISGHPKAEKLSREVLEMEGLDPYLIEKAKLIERSLKKK